MTDTPSCRSHRARGVAGLLVSGLTAVWLTACSHLGAPDAADTLVHAEQAMGSARLKTLHVSGAGTGATFGQAWQPSIAWPGLNYGLLARQIDYEAGAMREDFARSRSEPNGGGATPLMGQGEARASGFVRGDLAWNGSGNAAAASPVALHGRVHDLWTTPHGVIKAARQLGARAARRSADGVDYTTVSFTMPGRFEATAWIDPQGLVRRVDATVPHPVLGDSAVTTWYDDYRVVDGVQMPYRMRQSQGGHPTLDLGLREVRVNAPVDIAAPDSVRGFAERVVSTAVAPGVWYLTGGSHHSVLIEAADHLVLVESPLYDGRTVAVLAEARRLVPGKPLRQVVNSHHHFDHAGGLRAAAAEGATLVTSALAKPYFERVLANPNRVAPDALARSGRSPQIIGVDGKLELGDATRRIEVHELQGSVHAQGFLAVWLPRERLLIEADAYTPGAPGSPPPPAPNANHVNLVHNIERLGLDVERILPLHGRAAPMSELLAAIGRR